MIAMNLLNFGMVNLIGMSVEFEVQSANGKEVRTGEIKSLEYSDELNTIVFMVVTPHGNVAKLTHREISKFLKI